MSNIESSNELVVYSGGQTINTKTVKAVLVPKSNPASQDSKNNTGSPKTEADKIKAIIEHIKARLLELNDRIDRIRVKSNLGPVKQDLNSIANNISRNESKIPREDLDRLNGAVETLKRKITDKEKELNQGTQQTPHQQTPPKQQKANMPDPDPAQAAKPPESPVFVSPPSMSYPVLQPLKTGKSKMWDKVASAAKAGSANTPTPPQTAPTAPMAPTPPNQAVVNPTPTAKVPTANTVPVNNDSRLVLRVFMALVILIVGSIVFYFYKHQGVSTSVTGSVPVEQPVAPAAPKQSENILAKPVGVFIPDNLEVAGNSSWPKDVSPKVVISLNVPTHKLTEPERVEYVIQPYGDTLFMYPDYVGCYISIHPNPRDRDGMYRKDLMREFVDGNKIDGMHFSKIKSYRVLNLSSEEMKVEFRFSADK